MRGSLVRNAENEVFIADFLSKYILGVTVLVSVRGKAKFDLGLPHTEDNAADVHVNWLLPGIQGVPSSSFFITFFLFFLFPLLFLDACFN